MPKANLRHHIVSRLRLSRRCFDWSHQARRSERRVARDADRGRSLPARDRRFRAFKIPPATFEISDIAAIWHNGWKAVSFNPSGPPSRTTSGSVPISTAIFRGRYLAAKSRARLADMISGGLSEPKRPNVLPLATVLGPALSKTPRGYTALANSFTFHAGMGHVPTDSRLRAHPQLPIEAQVEIDGGSEG